MSSREVTAREIADNTHLFTRQRDAMPQAGVLEGGDDAVDENLVRLVVALQADAADRPLKYHNSHWVIYLKKPRKIKRLLWLAEQLNIRLDVRPHYKKDQTYIGVPEDARFREFLAPGKTFILGKLLMLSPRLRRVFIEELKLWDGSNNYYASTNVANVEIAQIVASVTGMRASIFYTSTKNKRPFALTTISKTNKTWLTKRLRVKRTVKTGKVYCVTVPSGWILTRRNGKVIVSSNSQQEYRLIVHFAERMGLPRASVAGDRYRTDPATDYHQMVADMTGLARKPAKDANFGKAFGAGVKKFAEMTNKTVDEAKAIYEQYDRELPFVRALAEAAEAAAQRRSYVRLIDGARLHYLRWEPRWRDWKAEQAYLTRVPNNRGVAPCDLDEARARIIDVEHPWKGALRRAFTRKAGNGLIQGSAARWTKLAMRGCWRDGIVPLLQVHDELDASVAQEKTGQRMAEIMATAVHLTIPAKVDAEFGKSWGDAEHQWEEVNANKKR